MNKLSDSLKSTYLAYVENFEKRHGDQQQWFTIEGHLVYKDARGVWSEIGAIQLDGYIRSLRALWKDSAGVNDDKSS